MIIVHCTSHFVDSRNLFCYSTEDGKSIFRKLCKFEKLKDVVHSHAGLSLPIEAKIPEESLYIKNSL